MASRVGDSIGVMNSVTKWCSEIGVLNWQSVNGVLIILNGVFNERPKCRLKWRPECRL